MISAQPENFETQSYWANQEWKKGSFSPMGGCMIDSNRPCSIAEWIDFVFLAIFAVEMVLKMLASGLIMHPYAYLRSTWNWLDFIVVVVGFMETFTTGLPG